MQECHWRRQNNIKPSTVCRISGTPFCFISGMGGSVLTVGVELLDAVLHLLVAKEDARHRVLEGDCAFTLVEHHGVVLEVERTALVVDIDHLEDNH